MAGAGLKTNNKENVVCHRILVYGFPKARGKHVAEFLSENISLESPIPAPKRGEVFDQSLPVDVTVAHDDGAGLPTQFEAEAGTLALLVLDAPESWITVALHQGKELSVALNEWLLAADAMVRLVEAMPESASLKVFQDIRRHPRKFAERLANRFCLEWRIRSELDEWPEEQSDPVLAVIAALCAIRHRTVGETWKRIRQHAARESDTYLKFPQIDVDLALMRYRHLAGENQLMFEQLHRMQVELEKTLFDAQSAQSEIRELREQVQSSEKRSGVQALRQKFRSSEEKLNSLENELEQMRKSTSWKITGPARVAIRGIRRLLRR